MTTDNKYEDKKEEEKKSLVQAGVVLSVATTYPETVNPKQPILSAPVPTSVLGKLKFFFIIMSF